MRMGAIHVGKRTKTRTRMKAWGSFSTPISVLPAPPRRFRYATALFGMRGSGPGFRHAEVSICLSGRRHSVTWSRLPFDVRTQFPFMRLPRLYWQEYAGREEVGWTAVIEVLKVMRAGRWPREDTDSRK